MSQNPNQPPQGWPSNQPQSPYGAPQQPQYGQQQYGQPQSPYGAPQQQYGQAPQYGQPPQYNQAPPAYQPQYQQPYQPQPMAGSSSMQPNVASMLSYLFGWITGLIFLAIEKNNQEVRFHAMQSILMSLGLTVVYFVLSFLIGALAFGSLALAGLLSLLMSLIGFAFFIAWIYMMVMAYQGKHVKLPVIGDMAERYAPTFLR
jgi:uncharacterized membrane protein